MASDVLGGLDRPLTIEPAVPLVLPLAVLDSQVIGQSSAWPIADLFVGTTAIVSGLAVLVVVLVRWSFFAQTDRARALASALGESVARGVYFCAGVTLVALGVWVLRG